MGRRAYPPRRLPTADSFHHRRRNITGTVFSIPSCAASVASRLRPAGRKMRCVWRPKRFATGEIVCLFPEGQLTRSGTLLRLRRGYEIIARQADGPVVPVWLDQLWGSIFSFQGQRFFTKWPRRIPYPAAVEFGEPLTPNEADIATVREQLLKLGERCYSRRPALRGHLGQAAVRGLARHPFRTAVIDGMDQSSLSRGKLLGAAAALEPIAAPKFSRQPNRDCPAGEQRRGRGKSRGRARGEGAGGVEFHERPGAHSSARSRLPV